MQTILLVEDEEPIRQMVGVGCVLLTPQPWRDDILRVGPISDAAVDAIEAHWATR